MLNYYYKVFKFGIDFIRTINLKLKTGTDNFKSF